MTFVAESGLWVMGPPVADVPAVAVLEVSGAILEWTVDDPGGASAVRMSVTDVAAADWLWRVVGPAGHAAIASGVAPGEVDLQDAAVAPLRRLAIGFWLRRWWPQSSRDGVVRLDRALLDAELAVLVSAAQEFFTEDTLDSDVEGLLTPHRAALHAFELGGDPRVEELVHACAELADDVGAWSTGLPEPSFAAADQRRDDYALAAGRADRTPDRMARGVASVDWVAVPPGIFDAAEHTIDWSVEPADASVIATVRVALTGAASAGGIDVALHSDSVSGRGVLDANGTAAMTVTHDDGTPLTENQAWDHDWSTTRITVGHDRSVAATEAAALRQRVRDVARSRLAQPGPDAFLAEILAAESDY